MSIVDSSIKKMSEQENRQMSSIQKERDSYEMMKSLENELQSITITVFGNLSVLSLVVTVFERRCCKFKKGVSSCKGSTPFFCLVMARM